MRNTTKISEDSTNLRFNSTTFSKTPPTSFTHGIIDACRPDRDNIWLISWRTCTPTKVAVISYGKNRDDSNLPPTLDDITELGIPTSTHPTVAHDVRPLLEDPLPTNPKSNFLAGPVS